MSDARLHKPRLYRLEGTDALPHHPALLGTRCECGYAHFPPQNYGCEQCGRYGDALTDIALSGRGTLTSVATVHIHSGFATDADTIPIMVPFTIATVELDEGPRVRGLLVEGTGAVRPGTMVVTSMADIGAGGTRILDLRFALES